MLPGLGGLTTDSGENGTFTKHRLLETAKVSVKCYTGNRWRVSFTSENLNVTFSGNTEQCYKLWYKPPCTEIYCDQISTLLDNQFSTHPFYQSLVLLWLTKVAADILCSDCILLALVHPSLVFLLLWYSVPEDFESLPYGLLAHWSDQRQ